MRKQISKRSRVRGCRLVEQPDLLLVFLLILIFQVIPQGPSLMLDVHFPIQRMPDISHSDSPIPGLARRFRSLLLSGFFGNMGPGHEPPGSPNSEPGLTSSSCLARHETRLYARESGRLYSLHHYVPKKHEPKFSVRGRGTDQVH